MDMDIDVVGGGAGHQAGGVASRDLIRRLERMGHPRVAVVGDLILDRYIWGDAERISQEAPVPLLRADHREHRLGGAASVATMLAALGAEVRLFAGVGADPEAKVALELLERHGIAADHLATLTDRPTTLKERYIGRAQDRHPQQMIRVDYEVRAPIPESVREMFASRFEEAARWADVVLVSDYDKGVCTPELLRALVSAARAAGTRVVADPIRGGDYAKYRGVHCMTPNRLEAGLAVGRPVHTTDDAIEAGRELVRRLDMEAALVTLDRDGMALVRADGTARVAPTRPRQVYDITGAGDMVLAMVGLALADGADYLEAAALGNVAGGLEVERIGVATLTRQEILRDLWNHDRPGEAKRPSLDVLLAEVAERKRSGQTVVFTNGCFDILHVGHVRLLRQARAQGDFLVVGLNSDAGVRRLKGESRPIVPQGDRAELLAALECVDAVVVFDEDTPLELIKAIAPDVLVKGGDYKPEDVVGRDEVEAAGGRLVLVPLVEGRSTTGIAERASGRIPAPPRRYADSSANPSPNPTSNSNPGANPNPAAATPI